MTELFGRSPTGRGSGGNCAKRDKQLSQQSPHRTELSSKAWKAAFGFVDRSERSAAPAQAWRGAIILDK
jgi:hypothetical protein